MLSVDSPESPPHDSAVVPDLKVPGPDYLACRKQIELP